jgi:quaternary ammonium compound-resistance protein SugE
MVAWVYLGLASLFEIAWAIGLKLSDGLSRPRIAAATIVAMVLAVVLLAQAQRTLPIGTAYAVWTGIGACGTAILGMVLFDEPHDIARLFCLALIVAGIVGLKALSPS